MMNKIMVTARKAKGLCMQEAAAKLQMDEYVYEEMELGLSPVDAQTATALEDFYDVPAFFFKINYTDIPAAIEALEKQREIIESIPLAQNSSSTADNQVTMARIGLDSLIAKQYHILLLMEKRELLLEKEALIELYNNLKLKITKG